MFLFQIINDVKKNTFNITFIICLCTSIILFLCSHAYYDIASDRQYSVIECILNYDKSLVESKYSFASVLLFFNGFENQYSKIFIPVLSSLPCLISYDAVLKSGFIRNEYYRCSKKKMIASKFLAGAISGGLISLLCVLMYGLIVFSVFPSISSYHFEDDFIIIENSFLKSINMFIGYIIYGMVSTILPFVLFELLRNVSIAESISFIIYYIYYMILNKLAFTIDEPQKIECFYPHSIISVFNKELDWKTIIFNFIFVFISFSVYYLCKMRRSDVCE